jgi:MerR family transcriptional regulator, light-induced transcriptional regulator
MVFVRVKKVKGFDYFYLVKSQWDSTRKTSQQQTVKYLGKASDFTIDDIPIEYRDNPKVLSILATSAKEQKKKLLITDKTKKQVFENLKNGEVEKILKVTARYKEQTSLAKFYDDVLKQVMYEVGTLWQHNKLEVGTEHICSNTANKAIHKITELYKRTYKTDGIVICTPDGELHNIACNIIESVLLEKGFSVFNISPSVPTDSVIKYIKDTNPSLILISVTLLDNIMSASRLAKNIGTHFNIPILIGGLAINNICERERKTMESVNSNVKLVINSPLEKLLQIVKDMTNNNPKVNN